MSRDRVIVVGAGIGGLACAADLAARGRDVVVLERAMGTGGKLRQVQVAGRDIDSGPTVFTMRWVFERLFADAGADFAQAVPTTPLDILARHAWSERERFDLHADAARTGDAVAEFSGVAERDRFIAFCAEARSIYQTLRDTFLTAKRPGPIGLARRIGLVNLDALFGLRPFETLWSALGRHFADPRLRQLFGRYSTYVGSSPFAAPATLMLIAHVEQDGVWSVDGGMSALAGAVQNLAQRHGASVRTGVDVCEVIVHRGRAAGVVLAGGERIDADAVVFNGDPNALASGALGLAVRHATPPTPSARRSLSAITWSAVAATAGFPLVRHNVFFGGDYRTEFDDLARGRLPGDPTVYVCAQDRAPGTAAPDDRERLLVLVNAAATGDAGDIDAGDVDRCEARTFERLERCGLAVRRTDWSVARTTPAQFHRLFPATGGALYGRASHGWTASFRRPGSTTAIPGLYLAGGATHPGAGVPMAALSGRLAAARLCADHT
ncbi:MAG: phytoene desaturase family protein [Rhodospirillaceae bacterium]|nr:phytoene desaturase family protein [Rhodospirillaceae bacterium]